MGLNSSKMIDTNTYLISYNCQINFFSNYKSNILLNYILNYKNKNFILCLQGLHNNKTFIYIKNYFKNNNINISNFEDYL